MVKRKSDYTVKKNENMRGGDGVVVVEYMLTPEEMNDKGRLYAKLILEPGSSIGHHVHEGEMESYYIVCGEAEIDDNGETVTVCAGESLLTRSGEGHSVRNVGKDTLEIIALILHK